MDQRSNQKRNLKNLKTNENGNTTHQNLWDSAKAVLGGKSIVVNAYIKGKKISSKQPNFTPQGSRKRRIN